MTNSLTGDEGLDLPEFDLPPGDPVELLRNWLDSARDRGLVEPNVVTLSTCAPSGVPSSRAVLLKEVDAQGRLVFTSHTGSRKGRELAANPVAAVTFYWRETLQQINVTGPMHAATAAESDRLFSARPVAAQATTIVSEQGEFLEDEPKLHRMAEELTAQGRPLPRPAGWSGYHLRPEAIEFWHGRASRLHRRLAYRLLDGVWSARRLQP